MKVNDILRMYNSLARFAGWEILYSKDSPHESNKEYRRSKHMIISFLILVGLSPTRLSIRVRYLI